jgi:protein N-terminal asparagine amidohydrolase
VLSGVLQEEAPPDTRTLFHNHPVYKDSASQLLSIPTKVMGPVGLLYVQQRELAVTVPHDSTCRTANRVLLESLYLTCRNRGGS